MSQPVEDLKIIQLRETAPESERNGVGDWSVVLNKPYTLQDGESLILKNSFIAETNQSNNLITVGSDFDFGVPNGSKTELTIEATIGYYVMDYYSNFPAPTGQGGTTPTQNKNDAVAVIDSQGNPNDIQNTGRPFVLMDKTTQTNEQSRLRFFKMEINPDSNFGKSGNYIQQELRYYVPKSGATPPYVAVDKILSLFTNADEAQGDPDEISQYITHSEGKTFIEVSWTSTTDIGVIGTDDFDNQFVFPTIPPSPPTDGSPYTPTDGGGIIISTQAIDDGLPAISISPNTKFKPEETTRGAAIIDEQTNTENGVNNTNALTKIISFGIEAKDYEPNELAALISSKFEKLNPVGDNHSAFRLSDNPLLLNTQQIKNEEFTPAAQPTFMSLDAKQQFQFIDQVNGVDLGYLIGSSQFSLTFDNDSQKFELGAIHSSRFTDAGDRCVEAFLNDVGKRVYMNKYSGIFFTRLSPLSLFCGDKDTPNSMRFSPSIITKMINHPSGITGLNGTFELPAALLDGVNTTGDFNSMDSLVIKNYDAGNLRHYDTAPTFSQFPPFQDVVSQTEAIISGGLSANATSGNLNGGYYLIEIDCGLPQDFRSSTSLNSKIKGIVSRFYNTSNFISSAEDAGIQYIHRGIPINLSRFRIRILAPDGNLAQDIKSGSSVFLQIVGQK